MSRPVNAMCKRPHYHATVVTTIRQDRRFIRYQYEEKVFPNRAQAVNAIGHAGGKDCPYCVTQCQRPFCLENGE